MNYIALCTPLFNHVAHLSQSLEGSGPALEPGAVVRDLNILVKRTRDTLLRRDPALGRLAWFAVACWVHETLAALPFRLQEAVHPQLPQSNAPSRFFQMLRKLSAGNEAEHFRILEVYAACLELGYLGLDAKGRRHPDRDACLDTCRMVLKIPATEDIEAMPISIRVKMKWRMTAAVLLWATPVGASLVLHTLYRSVLDELLQSLLG